MSPFRMYSLVFSTLRQYSSLEKLLEKPFALPGPLSGSGLKSRIIRTMASIRPQAVPYAPSSVSGDLSLVSMLTTTDIFCFKWS